jgi:hypothetical protein
MSTQPFLSASFVVLIIWKQLGRHQENVRGLGRSAERPIPEHRACRNTLGYSTKTPSAGGLHPFAKPGSWSAEPSRVIIPLAGNVAGANRSAARRLSGGE